MLVLPWSYILDLNYAKVRNIILDDRWKKIYKPDRQAINRIGLGLPDCNIFGFGFRPDKGYWAVMVESYSFPDNPYGVIRDVSIKDISQFKPQPRLVTKKGWLW